MSDLHVISENLVKGLIELDPALGELIVVRQGTVDWPVHEGPLWVAILATFFQDRTFSTPVPMHHRKVIARAMLARTELQAATESIYLLGYTSDRGWVQDAWEFVRMECLIDFPGITRAAKVLRDSDYASREAAEELVRLILG